MKEGSTCGKNCGTLTTGNSDRHDNGDCKCITGAIINVSGFSCTCGSDYVLDLGVCKPKCTTKTFVP